MGARGDRERADGLRRPGGYGQTAGREPVSAGEPAGGRELVSAGEPAGREPMGGASRRLDRATLGRSGRPLDLLTARFDRHRYAPHAHDEFTIGVCVGGSEFIDYRGGRIETSPGSIVVLAPGETHTGGPAASDGYAYRAMYAEVPLLTEGTYGIPHFRDPSSTTPNWPPPSASRTPN
jgi:hypothetical protein